jgi:hypothetical protein
LSWLDDGAEDDGAEDDDREATAGAVDIGTAIL